MIDLNNIKAVFLILTLSLFVGSSDVYGESMVVNNTPKLNRVINSYYKTPFKNPQAIHIDMENRELYVVDEGANEILILDIYGTPISKIGKESGIDRPLDIVTRNGNYYISQSSKEFIEIFDIMGNFVDKLFVEGRKFAPGRMHSGKDGKLYVVNKNQTEVVVFDEQDNFIKAIGTGDVRIKGFSGIAIGHDRIYIFTPFNLYRTIHVYLKSGEYSHSFESLAESGSGGSLGLPLSGIVDDDENLWLVDGLKGILVYNKNDKKIAKFGQFEFKGTRKTLEFPIDIDFGAKNEVYILEEKLKQISIFR